MNHILSYVGYILKIICPSTACTPRRLWIEIYFLNPSSISFGTPSILTKLIIKNKIPTTQQVLMNLLWHSLAIQESKNPRNKNYMCTRFISRTTMVNVSHRVCVSRIIFLSSMSNTLTEIILMKLSNHYK